MSDPDPTKIRIKPVYDVAFYGQDKIIPFGTDTLVLQSITWSALNELIQLIPGTGGSMQIEDYSRIISNVDTLGIAHQGDGTRFDRTYEWLTDMSAWVYKFDITICVALAVTDWTSGDHSIDVVRFRISEVDQSGTPVQDIADQRIVTGMTTIGSAVNAAIIIHFSGNKPFKISQGNIVRIRISFESTDTLVATSFEGIMPLFYFQDGNLSKILAESAMSIHLHPSLDHAFPVFRDDSSQNLLDFSGVGV